MFCNIHLSKILPLLLLLPLLTFNFSSSFLPLVFLLLVLYIILFLLSFSAYLYASLRLHFLIFLLFPLSVCFFSSLSSLFLPLFLLLLFLLLVVLCLLFVLFCVVWQKCWDGDWGWSQKWYLHIDCFMLPHQNAPTLSNKQFMITGYFHWIGPEADSVYESRLLSVCVSVCLLVTPRKECFPIDSFVHSHDLSSVCVCAMPRIGWTRDLWWKGVQAKVYKRVGIIL